MELKELKGIGSARLKALNEAGIASLRDFVLYFPSDYRDLTRITPLQDIVSGGSYAVRVTVCAPATQAYAKGLLITRATVSDGTDAVSCVWYNQPWLKASLPVGRQLLLYGKAETKAGRITLVCPSLETEAGMISVYKPLAGIAPKTLGKMISEALTATRGEWPDPLPAEILQRFSLMDYESALNAIHHPASREQLTEANYRMSFESLLLFQLAAGLMRKSAKKGVSIECPDPEDFWRALPFPPTGAQKRVLSEIERDLRGPSAMARLVQGDVGCGKTAVAFGAIYMAVRGGYQCAMMAPTEVLAAQHYESARQTLAPLGIRVGLLTGSMTRKAHEMAREKLITGEWQAVFGTHALITEAVRYHRLGLVITDEQHRFGVRQRSMLGEKGEGANVLVMSATPIPRTLSLILYGDLDISIIDEMPEGRKPVKTRVVPESKRQGMYGFIRKEVQRGRQAYFVCPLVEDSEAVEALSAEELYKNLKSEAFEDLNVCLVHGKMKPKEKEEAIESFRSGRASVMVSTTVIEVGVNVPNATVMVIENAERFGLAQLHQLRGRVGRGSDEAWCFLMADATSRLKILTETNDGFVIAQKDMELRGPGEIFGTRQSGQLLSFSDGADAQTLKTTHELAREIFRRPERDETRAALVSAAEAWLKKRGETALMAN